MLILNHFASRNKRKRRVSQTDTKEKKMIPPLATSSNETDLLTYVVSDEMLESAGSNETDAAFTLGSCTGLSECPG